MVNPLSKGWSYDFPDWEQEEIWSGSTRPLKGKARERYDQKRKEKMQERELLQGSPTQVVETNTLFEEVHTPSSKYIDLVRKEVEGPVQLLNDFTGQYKKRIAEYSTMVIYRHLTGKKSNGYLSFVQLIEMASILWPAESSSETRQLLSYREDRMLLRSDLLESDALAMSLSPEVCGHFWQFSSSHFVPEYKEQLLSRIQKILESPDGFDGIGKKRKVK